MIFDRRKTNERALRPRKSALVAAFALCIAANFASAQDTKPTVPDEWKLSVAVGPAYALGVAAETWAKRLGDPAGGGLPTKVYPGAALADRDPARELLALRNGAADFAVGSSLYWSQQAGGLGVVSLPWIAPDARQLDALAKGPIAERLLAAVEGAGVVPLAIAPLGHRELATRERPVRSPADLAGMRVRVGAPQLVELFTALGAKAGVMSYAEAQPAFAAGTLDAQEGTLATMATSRLDAVGFRHVVLWGAVAEVAVFAMNRQRWDALDDIRRARVRVAAAEAASELAQWVRKENESALTALRKRGLAATQLSVAERAAFATAARPVYDRWAAAAGADLARAAEAAVTGATQ